MTRKLFAAVVASVMGFATIGATCTWTGAAGDGLWSTPGNWQGNTAPVDGDSVTIPANTSATMDTGDTVRSLAGLTFTQPVGNFTLKGAGLLVNNNVTLPCYGGRTTVFDCPITLTGDNRTLTLGSSTNSVTKFLKPLTATTIAATSFTGNTEQKASTGKLQFSKPLEYTTLKICYNNLSCNAANILAPTGLVYFTGTGWNHLNHGHSLDLNGFDQTIGGLTTDESTSQTYHLGASWQNRARNIKSTGGAAVLTIKPKSSYVASCRLIDNISVVLDATDVNVVQTFASRTNLTEGAIVISNGTLRLTKTTSAGAAGPGAAFMNLRGIVVCSGGKLWVDSDNVTAEPFPALKVLSIESGGVVTMDSGTFPAGIDPTKSYSVASSLADTVWTALSGNWSAAANWSAGVPTTAKNAAIVGSTDGVAVTLDAPAADVKDIAFESPLSTRAKLTVTSTLPMADGKLTMSGDSEIEIGNGGCVTNTGVVEATKTASLLDNGAKMTIKNGGLFTSVGTSASFTINRAKLKIEEGGRFVYDQGKKSARIEGSGGGELDIQGELVVYRHYKESANSYFNFAGEKVRLSGTGRIFSKDGKARADGTAVIGGTIGIYAKEVELSDGAVIAADTDQTWYSRLNLSGPAASTHAKLTFKDHSGISNSFFTTCFTSPNFGSLTVDMSQVDRGFLGSGITDGVSGIGYTLEIGGGRGRVQFDYGGKGFSVGSYNFSIGNGASAAEDPGYTELNLRNGARVSCAGNCAASRGAISAKQLSAFYGTTIGAWRTPPAAQVERLTRARMTLDGNGTSFSSGAGHVILGLGRGQGQYVQMQGTTKIGTDTGYYSNKDEWLPKEQQVSYRCYGTNSVFMIGVYGGLGECIVSNGTFHSNLRTYIGGITTNQYYDGAWISLGNALNMANAEGYLRIMGGNCTNVNPVYVGSHGTGTIEIGSRGSFTAGTVVLSNQTASVLAFKLDAANGYRSGESSVKKLVVTDGASLRVDVGDYCGKSKTLLTFAAKEGNFQPAKITVTGANADLYATEVRSDRIFLKANIGTVILLR